MMENAKFRSDFWTTSIIIIRKFSYHCRFIIIDVHVLKLPNYYYYKLILATSWTTDAIAINFAPWNMMHVMIPLF